jgi:YgiT-type zinc finger domain-containing protein
MKAANKEKFMKFADLSQGDFFTWRSSPEELLIKTDSGYVIARSATVIPEEVIDRRRLEVIKKYVEGCGNIGELFSGATSMSCPRCESEDVTSTITRYHFDYGTGKGTVQLAAEVPLWSCGQCDFQYFDDEARKVKDRVVSEYLSKKTLKGA